MYKLKYRIVMWKTQSHLTGSDQISAGLLTDSPVSTGVLNHNVVILIDATNCASGREGFKHAIRPAAMAVLQGLDNLQVKVNVDQIANLQTSRISVAILLA